LSGLGLVLYSLSLSFAAVDWVMSLDPHWGSTIYVHLSRRTSLSRWLLRHHADPADALQSYREIIKPTQFMTSAS